MADLKLYGPPGVGKTTYGLTWLEERVEEGADLYSAAFVSYTKAAVNVGKERLTRRFGVDEADMPYARTLHSLCLRANGITHDDWLSDKHLPEFGKEFSYDLTRTGTPRDEDDMDRLRTRAGEDAPYLRVWDFSRQRLICSPRAAFNAFGAYDQEAIAGLSFARFCDFVQKYENWKKREGLWDFTDLMLGVVAHPVSLPLSVALFDEAQDFSPLMHQVADILSANAEHRAFLGDDDQAIFCHDGAVPELFNQRQADQVVKLRQSHRLPEAVVRLAARIIGVNRSREPKETDAVTQEIVTRREAWNQLDIDGYVGKEHHISNVPLLNGESWYVLARNWYLLEDVAASLEEQGVPYRLAHERKRSPWEDGVTKRAVNAFLKLHQREPVTLEELRLLTERTASESRSDNQTNYWKRGAKVAIKKAAGETPLRLVLFDSTLMSQWGLTQEGLSAIVSGQVSSLKISERDSRAFQAAWTAGNWDQPIRIELSSIHGKKGLEAQNVACILGCTGRTARAMTYRHRIEEENRIAYVAATRAQRRFIVVAPQPGRNLFEWNPFRL